MNSETMITFAFYCFYITVIVKYFIDYIYPSLRDFWYLNRRTGPNILPTDEYQGVIHLHDERNIDIQCSQFTMNFILQTNKNYSGTVVLLGPNNQEFRGTIDLVYHGEYNIEYNDDDIMG